MAQGLQNLINFRDDLQQEMPEPTGLDKLSLLQNLTMNSMAENAADNQLMVTPQQYLASGGLVGLPVVQAPFGGFLKKIASIPKKVFKAVKRVAKSPFGKLAITAAPALFGGLPMVFANPAANAAFWSGGTTLLTGGKPEDALKSAILSGGLAGLTSPTGKGIFGGKNVDIPKGFTGDPTKYSSQFGSYGDVGLAQTKLGFPGTTNFASGMPAFANTSPEVLENIGASNISVAPDRLGGALRNLSVAESNAALEAAQQGAPSSGGIIDTIRDVGGSAIKRAGEAVTQGYDKFKNLGNIEKGLLLAGGATALSGLGGGPEIQAMSQYTPGQLSDADVGFDQQRAFYFDTITKKPLTISEALAKMQTAAQNFGPGGQRQASNVSLGFEDVDDKVLSASGGLIGMMYGGPIPKDNMDVKYKEFSGMVGGEGTGMEDNVYMPIVEGEQGQQIATLAVSPKEYVVDANTMSLLGNGNPDEGAEVMDQTVKDIRKKATGQTKQQKEIDGLAALNRMRRSV